MNELVENAVREGWWLGPGLGAGGPANHPGTQAGRQAGSPARLYDMFSRAWGAIRLVTPCSTEAPQPMQNTQAAAGRGCSREFGRRGANPRLLRQRALHYHQNALAHSRLIKLTTTQPHTQAGRNYPLSTCLR